jgi:hypothetical protein
VLENWVLAVFESKRKKEIGRLRKINNEELHNLQSPTNIVRDKCNKDEMDGICSVHGRAETSI